MKRQCTKRRRDGLAAAAPRAVRAGMSAPARAETPVNQRSHVVSQPPPPPDSKRPAPRAEACRQIQRVQTAAELVRAEHDRLESPCVAEIGQGSAN